MQSLFDPLARLIAPLAAIAALEAILIAIAVIGGIAVVILSATGRPRLRNAEVWGVVECLPSRAYRRWRQPVRVASLLAAGMAAGVPLAIAIIDRFYFDDAAHWLCEHASSDGSRLSFQKAEGDLFSGRIQLSGAALHRATDSPSQSAIVAQKLSIDVAVWPLFFGSRRFDEVSIADAVVQFADAPPLAAPRNRGVEVRRLHIDRARWELPAESGRRPVAIELCGLTAHDWRGDWSLHDLLFRSTAIGAVHGRVFKTAANETDSGWLGKIELRGLPVEDLSRRLGGWWQLLSAGTVDIEVSHRRPQHDLSPIDLRVKLVLRNLQMNMPAGVPSYPQTWLWQAAEYLAANAQRVSLQFDLLASAEAFRDVSSTLAGDVREALAESSRRALERRTRDASVMRSLLHDSFELFDDEETPVALSTQERSSRREGEAG